MSADPSTAGGHRCCPGHTESCCPHSLMWETTLISCQGPSALVPTLRLSSITQGPLLLTHFNYSSRWLENFC